MPHQSTYYIKESRSRRIVSSGGLEADDNKLESQPIITNRGPPGIDSGGPVENATTSSWSDLYSIDWKPKECVLKFRQHVEDFQIGANLEVFICEVRRCSNIYAKFDGLAVRA